MEIVKRAVHLKSLIENLGLGDYFLIKVSPLREIPKRGKFFHVEIANQIKIDVSDNGEFFIIPSDRGTGSVALLAEPLCVGVKLTLNGELLTVGKEEGEISPEGEEKIKQIFDIIIRYCQDWEKYCQLRLQGGIMAHLYPLPSSPGPDIAKARGLEKIEKKFRKEVFVSPKGPLGLD